MELARDFAQHARDVAAEGTPHLDVKGVFANAPKHDIGLRQHGARAHADGKFAQVQIERAGAAQHGRRMGAADFECELPVADIDQGVRYIDEGALERIGDGLCRFFIGAEQSGIHQDPATAWRGRLAAWRGRRVRRRPLPRSAPPPPAPAHRHAE